MELKPETYICSQLNKYWSGVKATCIQIPEDLSDLAKMFTDLHIDAYVTDDGVGWYRNYRNYNSLGKLKPGEWITMRTNHWQTWPDDSFRRYWNRVLP